MKAPTVAAETLGMKDHRILCKSLSEINERDLIQLGGALGLHYPKLQRMKHLPEELVAAWLRAEDQVLDMSGRPTWASLVKCLEDIKQNGTASTIKFWYGDKIQKPKFNENRYWNDKWLFRLGVAVLIVAIVCLVYYWPTLVYEVNLRCYSKTLPYPSQNFFGRDREIKEVMRLIDFHGPYQDIRVVNIIGSPGFGKSTLAIHVGHEMVQKSVVVHYINLADFPDKPSVKQVLSEKVLESSQISAKSANLDRLVRWADDRFWYNLIILDNCDHVVQNQREDFQLTLERLVETSKNIKVLMTSRIELVINPYSKSYLIHELSTEAACKVLDYGEQQVLTKAQKLRIANKTGNVPLAISIFKSLLDRAGTPPPEQLIRELESPIRALSPPDFQLHRQVNATLCMSYNYLGSKLQVVSRQLTLFPGSFSREAGVIVLSNGSQSDIVQKDIEESLTSLVRSSLLQYDQRKDRFHYHQLIKEYFLHISNHNDTITLYPAYYIHYATLLNIAHANFSQNFEVAIAIIDSDRHNFHHLLNALKNMSELHKYFLPVVAAILNSVSVGLLNVRFPKNDLCVAMRIAIDKFDRLIVLDTIVRLATIDDFEYAYLYSGRTESFFHYYVQLMTHLQTCSKKDGILSVHDDRKVFIETYRYHMDHTDYIEFNKHLIKHYSHINDTENAKECRTKIMIQVDHHEFFCPQSGECTYDSIGSASYEIGEYQKAAILFEKALEEQKDGMKAAGILSALIKTYSQLREYDKMFETADRLCVQHGIRNIMNSSVSDLFWNYHTVAASLSLCEEFGLTEQARILFKNYTNVLLEILSQMENSGNDTIDSTGPSPSNELIYSILKHMFDIEHYEPVIVIGSYAVKVFSKNNSLKMLSNKLKFQLLLGKAKIHGCSFDTSDGMKDIEDVLQTILNLEDRLASNFTEERKIACWYLISQVKYIRICYNVTSTIRRVIMNLMFTPIYYKLASDGFAHLHTQCNIKPKQAQIQLSSSTDLQTSVEFMLPLFKLWQVLSNDIESSLLLINSCQILSHFEGFAQFILIYVDVLLLWLKLIFPYIVYIYFRQPYLFKVFMAELEFWWLYVPPCVISYNCTIFKCFPTMPKQIIQTLLFGPGILRVVRDPRLKYEEDSPYARLLIDMPREDAYMFTPWCSFFISVNVVFLICGYSHQIFGGAFL